MYLSTQNRCHSSENVVDFGVKKVSLGCLKRKNKVRKILQFSYRRVFVIEQNEAFLSPSYLLLMKISDS